MGKMCRITDRRGNVVWVNRDEIVTIQEEKASPGSVITTTNHVEIHVSEKPDWVMMHCIGT